MPEFLTLQYIGENFFWIITSPLILFIIATLVLVIRAPFIALRIIQRERPLGRDKYRENGQTDRFMKVWIMGKCSSENPQNQRIDNQLIILNLFEKKIEQNRKVFACTKRGRYCLRNWVVFLLALVLRILILGDRFEAIKIDQHCSVQKLKALYWITIAILTLLPVVLFLAIYYIFS